MIKICIIVTGAVRLDSNSLIENIKINFGNFNDYDITSIFVTWEPIKKTYITHNINYYYDYDKNNIIETVKPFVNEILFMDNLEINDVVKLQNGMPPLFMYQLSYAKDYIIKNNLTFDYIVKIRNDMQIKIYNIENFLNDNVYVPPPYWLQSYQQLDLLNDHFFIMPFGLFKSIDISYETIINTTPKCRDCEVLNLTLIKPTKLISNKCIQLYKTLGGAKVLIEN
jgi:hypothetical protein